MILGGSARNVSFEENVGLDLQRGRGRAFQAVVPVIAQEQQQARKPESGCEPALSDSRADTLIHLSSELLMPWTYKFPACKILIILYVKVTLRSYTKSGCTQDLRSQPMLIQHM